MRCAHHADRLAVGVCVACHALVCDSCTTRLQGRNFCRRCLEERGAARADDAPLRGSPLARAGVLLLALLSASVLLGGLSSVGFLLYLLG